MRALYVEAVVLCYGVPLVARYSYVPFPLDPEKVWGICFIAALLLAAVGFCWSAFSYRARISLGVFLATLASYVYAGSIVFIAG